MRLYSFFRFSGWAGPVRRSVVAFLLLLLCFLPVACSSTKGRIKKNEDLFNSYLPDVQAMIKSNRIDRGFDTTQVYLSLGNANRTEQIDGFEVWTYHKTHTDSISEEKSAGEYRDEMDRYNAAVKEGKDNLTHPSTHRTVTLYRTRVSRIVRFKDGAVVEWEEPANLWIDDWHRR